MVHKKIVLVIVEGPSDDEALGVLLDKIFDDNRVYVHIAHCDLTTERGSGYSTILRQLGEVISRITKQYHWKKSDFQEIIQIIDMDGAYIPDEGIIEDSNARKTLYSLTEIRTINVQGIVRRNATKRSCIDKLSSTYKIWDTPYRIYYMSSNLDHVLYNKQNSTDIEKEEDAFVFSERYKDDTDGFIQYICESDFSVKRTYSESWVFIKEEMHSLQRYTNFGICLQNVTSKNEKKNLLNSSLSGK